MRRATSLVLSAGLVMVGAVAQAPPASAAAFTSSVVSVAGGGGNDGVPATQAAVRPFGADLGPDGTLYLADPWHNRVRAVATNGVISTLAGTGDLVDGQGTFQGDGGPAADAQLHSPVKVHTTPAGDVIITDRDNHRVRLVDHATGLISTIAGNGTVGAAEPAADATSQPLDPRDAVYDPGTGTIDIADESGGKVWARHPDGSLTLLAGGGPTYPGDGGPATSGQLISPSTLAFLPDHDLLIADVGAGAVRAVHNGTITTVAGAPYPVTTATMDSPDGLAAAGTQLPGAETLAVAGDGTVFVGSDRVIRTFQVGGALGTVPGPPCAHVAAVDGAGRLLLACTVLYRRETNGSYSRIAGSLEAVATSYPPADGIAQDQASFDPSGGLLVRGDTTLVASRGSVDAVGPDGVVHHVAGSHGGSAVPDGSPALATPLSEVQAIAPAPDGGLFLDDAGKVDLVTADGALHRFTSGAATGFSEGQAAGQAGTVGPMTSAGNGDLYVAWSSALAVISWSTRTVHVLTTDLRVLDPLPVPPSVYESPRSLALAPDGRLVVLADVSQTSWAYPHGTSRVLLVDPVTLATTVLYNGPRLSQLTASATGTMFVTEPTFAGDQLVDVLGSDGSTTRVAGGGHLTAASQSGSELYLPDVAGLGIAADGGLLMASWTAGRVLELLPGYAATTPQPVTNLQVVSTQGSNGTWNQQVTWDPPAQLPPGSQTVVTVDEGRGDGPGSRLDASWQSSGPTSLQRTGVTPGMRYRFTVYVVSAADEQSAPTTVEAVVPGDVTPTAAPTIGDVYSADSTLTLSWGSPADSDLARFEVRISPGQSPPDPGLAPVYSGPGNSMSSSGLVVGQVYAYAVTAYDFTGNAATTTGNFVAGQNPDPLLGASSPPQGAWLGPSAALYPLVRFASAGAPVCTIDSAAVGCSLNQAVLLSHLSGGTHTFRFRLQTAFGSGPTLTRSWNVDTSAPSISPTAPAPFTLAPAVTFSWKATDTGSGVALYRYRVAHAATTGSFTAYSTPTSTTAAHVTLSVVPGTTYCLEAQAVDRVGNASAWSAPRCTTRPLDDRGLTATAGWTRLSASSFYLGTAVQTRAAGSRLTRYATFRQLAIVATTCPGCGTISVYSGGTLLKTISLASTTTHRQVLIVLPRLADRSATITIKVVSTNKTVQVDGLGIARA